MAFITPITCQYTRQSLAAGYCKAEVTLATAHITRIELTVWESQEARIEHPNAPAFVHKVVHVLTTESNLRSDNPVDYAYRLLQASGEFPDAVWNI